MPFCKSGCFGIKIGVQPGLLLTLLLIYTYFCPVGQYDMDVAATSHFPVHSELKGYAIP